MTSPRPWTANGRDTSHFSADLQPVVVKILDRHYLLPGPGEKYPAWVTGCIGDPSADVWFIAENPSAGTARRAIAGATVEDQWNTSDGDKLLRETLIKHQFKGGDCDSTGDWHCYITDVVKSAYIVRDWNAKTPAERNLVAECWAPVLDREIAIGKPKLLVTVGARAEQLLKHVVHAGLLPNLPENVFKARENVKHYVYIMNYPAGKLPARHGTPTGSPPGRIGSVR